jgi:H+/Cl- antiporter ClcA
MAYRIPYFKNIGLNYSVRLQMYTCAIAVGTCCSAGAPFGGVLFALELTSTFFMVGNIWKGLLATTSAVIMYQILHSKIPSVKPPQFTSFEEY